MTEIEVKVPILVNGREVKIVVDAINGQVTVSGMTSLVCELPFIDREGIGLKVDKETKLCLAIQGAYGDNWNFRVSHGKLMPWYHTVPIIQANPCCGGDGRNLQLKVREWEIQKGGWRDGKILSLLPYPLAESES